MRAAFLAAAMLFAPAAVRADGGGPLAEAILRVSELESLADSAASALAAGATLAVSSRAAAAYCASSPTTIESMGDKDRTFLQACDAFVENKPDHCRRIPAAVSPPIPADNCLKGAADMAMARAISAPGPAAQSGCEANFGLSETRVSAPERALACAAVASGGDTGARCETLRRKVPALFVGRPAGVCERYLDYVWLGRGCAAFPAAAVQGSLCLSIGEYQLALRAGDPRSCGEDYLCRALMGDAGACRRRREEWTAAACRRPAGWRPAAAASPAAPERLLREIAATIALAGKSTLEPQERSAVSRLDAMMRGRAALAPAVALSDMAALRAALIEDLLYRSELQPAPPDPAAIAGLRRRVQDAQGKLTDTIKG